MRLSSIAEQASAHPFLENIIKVSTGHRILNAVCPAVRPFLVASQYLYKPRKTLIIAPNYERAIHWQAKLTLWGIPTSEIHQLPSGISALFEDAAPELSALSDRIGALYKLIGEKPSIIIATPQSALERTLPREILEQSFIELKVNQELNPDELTKKLVEIGYEFSEPVQLPGQFSKRGGIIDIYAMGLENPIRIELFGDQIESMRQFEPSSQKSISTLEKISILPAREAIYQNAEAGSFTEMLLHATHLESANLSEEAATLLEENISADATALDGYVYFDRLPLYRPLLHPDSGSAIDLLGEEGLIVLDEFLELEAISARAEEELTQALNARAERGEILKSFYSDYMLSLEHITYSSNVLALDSMGEAPDWFDGTASEELHADSLEPYHNNLPYLTKAILDWKKNEYSIILSTDQPTRTKEILSQIELYPHEDGDNKKPLETAGLTLCHGNLSGGFTIPDMKLALITDYELFGVGRLRLPQKRFREGVPISTILDLKEGDYVVHINFGIGIFRGLTTRVVEGVAKEYLFIEYAEPDKLFVPADQLDRIQKYLNPTDNPPKIYRLSGGEWKKIVSKAREEAREFARDLIKLYAERKKVQRPSYPTDTPWQTEMESTFPWVETPSQFLAINDVKSDLEQSYPMDRLVCGDVGFGKTEVAIRAAFKVAQEHKQVAVLCPTTILSEQHYRNFSERLAGFPTKLDILNRFRTPAERKKVLHKLSEGELDLVIGTHAILGKEIKFKNLGLVIIDEEQRFGVKQKELLKTLRTNVDVLTLSATPIPRTLNMALMDIRQMSLINDPPPGRLPVRTFVRPYSKQVIAEAVLRELARGGQVYYVYNRVQGIYHIAEALRKMIPSARIGVAHGQMHEQELEPVMVGFIKGEIDVLVSTTIVESGLDISNANTLIVENAHKFGLAQLYQLRGRVGRSDRQAYAYLLHPPAGELTEGATARLQALREFSALGSGYSLALRDLQIRGTGDLLGAKQHGTMATVGYELYTQLIHQEVQLLKPLADGKEAGETRDPLEGLEPLPSVDIPISAYIPPAYIEDQAQRLYYYKRMMGCRSFEELTTVENEIKDRYGEFPTQVTNAFSIMRLRLQCLELKVEKVNVKEGQLVLHFHSAHILSPRFIQVLHASNRKLHVADNRLFWPYSGNPLQVCENLFEVIKSTLEQIHAQRAALADSKE